MTPSQSFDPESIEHHVVLVAPEVHWNTGNIGRTCLGAGAHLHLIRPLGFSLDDRQVRRAGLDYWSKVQLSIWENFDHFLEGACPLEHEIGLLTKSGTHPYWRLPLASRNFMIFGSETRGLPQGVLKRYPDRTYYIPIRNEIRCLNLSTAVGIALYDTVRRQQTCLSL